MTGYLLRKQGFAQTVISAEKLGLELCKRRGEGNSLSKSSPSGRNAVKKEVCIAHTIVGGARFRSEVMARAHCTGAHHMTSRRPPASLRSREWLQD